MSTNQLFKKVACFTDIHFGNKHNSRQHNDDCEEFIRWFVKESKARGAEICIMLGDFHHHRASINISTLNYSVSNLQYLNDNFEHTYIIAGNHDLFYREKREISSLAHGKNLPNVTIVNEPMIEGNVAIVPWLIEDEWKTVKKTKTKYMFGHFEIPGFRMNAQISMPDHGEINRQHFKHQDYVFSGHFHGRQQEDNIHYIGNPFGHNYSDAWDFNRGAMFLEWDGDPEYANWEDGPRYITCGLSDLLENSEEFLFPKVSARVTLDTTLTFEDSNFLKETLMENYEVRDMKFIHDRNEVEDMEFDGEIIFQTIDEIVAEQLAALDMDGTFDNKKLMDIYNNLC